MPPIRPELHLPLSNRPGWPWADETVGSLHELPVGHEWPKISIVTPSFNQGDFIETTIRSVLLQGYPNLEYIIIDGGSTDNSVDLIRKYEPWLAYWVNERDRGQSHAINKGFDQATGALLTWLNSDDYLLPGALFKIAQAYMDCSHNVGAICGQGRKVDVHGKLIYQTKLDHIDRQSLFRWSYGKNFLQPSCFFTKKAWDECGPLDEDIHIAMDLDLWLRMSEKFLFTTINDCISVALGHPDAKTTAMSHQMYLDFAFVYIKNGNINAARELLNERIEMYVDMENKFNFLRKITFVDLIVKILKSFGIYK